MAKIDGRPELFPILATQTEPLRGLGRMAAESEYVDAGHDVEFRSLAVRSVLNQSVSKRLKWMAWSINPYRGCEFGCRYCYARYTHEFLAPAVAGGEPLRGVLAGAEPAAVDLRDPEAFERQIFVKENAAWLLEQDLRRLAKQGRADEEIALGTATDPWQPIERRLGVTRSLLEVMARRDGLRLGIVTKSTLIERDIDLLQEIGRRSTLVVHITITTPDADLARKLEPRAPRPDLRFQTVRRLRAAGIRTGILNSPLLPGITDSPEAIDAMAALAKAADASFFAAMPLFLKPCSRPTYFEFVREHFPHLQVLYAEKFRDMDFAARPYRERLRALVTAACGRHGLCERMTDALLTRDAGEEKKRAASTWSPEAQGLLFG
ncbi:DNA repair photolyase [Terriglobus roseus DSM 18391]|uniref:DNA repair photolyase n=1 Tax=Terriglobus roseus (strain DSM 18391 / NRRL B-41598 / KBS 63) TaxID=926566 RepID=I3ZKI2_TERRK|nr:radical SAM protein [Terriglobus roseus]AFL89750.1 DNA repair photolyase [Terriglobus roseus DSM 18391]